MKRQWRDLIAFSAGARPAPANEYDRLLPPMKNPMTRACATRDGVVTRHVPSVFPTLFAAAQWVLPEVTLRFLRHVRATQADVLQGLIAHARQHFPFAVQFIPAGQLVQQIRDDVNGVFFYCADIVLTFHLVALRLGWLKCRAGAKINPTNVSYAIHLGD